MNLRHTPRTSNTVALLIALDDGHIIVDTDSSLPAIDLEPDEDPATSVHRLEGRFNLGDEVAHLAVTDTEKADDGTAVHHHLVWCGPFPTTWRAPHPYRTVPVGQILANRPQREAARIRAGCRAGLLGDTVRLRDGRHSDIGPTKAERTRAHFTWHPGILKEKDHEQTIRQVWGWLTDPAGRVLVLLDHHGRPSLPGGRPEPGETWEITLTREAAEEAAACLGNPVVLGIQHVVERSQAPYAQLRMTAPLLQLGPARPDPDNGEIYRRVLVPARQANLLLGWGPEGDAQAAAVTALVPTAPGRALRHVAERGWSSESAEENLVRSPGPRPER